MRISKKFGIRTFVATAAAAAVIPLGATPAGAETQHFTQEVPFSATHACTGEFVQGDTTLRITTTVTESTSGNMNVHTTVHGHGTQLIGQTSGDTYNFNEGQDSHYHFTVGSTGGHEMLHGVFVHHGEDFVGGEVAPGLDDFWQKFLIIIAPNGTPTVVHADADCR